MTYMIKDEPEGKYISIEADSLTVEDGHLVFKKGKSVIAMFREWRSFLEMPLTPEIKDDTP